MVDEVKEGNVPGKAPGGAPPEGTETQETLPAADVQERVSALEQELARQRAQAVADQRLMQGKIDKDIARERRRVEEREQALRTFVRGRMEKEGATLEELTEFEGEYGRFAEGLSDKEKAGLYDQLVTSQAQERETLEFQQELQEGILKGITEQFGVKIPLDHPDLKKDDPPTFFLSATKLAKKLLDEAAQAKAKGTLTETAESGALSALGGGPSGTLNPLAGKVVSPDEAHAEWVKRGRPVPKAK